MGRITAAVTVTNVLDPAREICCHGLVDTGASGLILPAAWKERLGTLQTVRIDTMETADQRIVRGEVCGPVRVEIDGFDPVLTEVTFLDMKEPIGGHEPLIGYIVLEQSRAAVDMMRHQLVKLRHADLKRLAA